MQYLGHEEGRCMSYLNSQLMSTLYQVYLSRPFRQIFNNFKNPLWTEQPFLKPSLGNRIFSENFSNRLLSIFLKIQMISGSKLIGRLLVRPFGSFFLKIGAIFAVSSLLEKGFLEMHLFIQLLKDINNSSFTSFKIFC